ncbi:aminoglycoside phosphotransferase family protein [Streptomyces sp. NPDC003860]
MTHPLRPSVPQDLLHWITRHMPDLADVTDASWPRSNSHVWRLVSPTKTAFVKINPTSEDYEREVHAYEHATRALASNQAPRLLASDPALRAIMTSPLPGKVVRGLHLPPETEARVHHLAGQLLHQWHHLDHPADPGPARDRAIAAVTRQADETATRITQIADELTPAQISLAKEAIRELPRLAEQLPLVYRHGDYSPRNWLWDADRQRLGLIDFEKADHGIAVDDLVWLAGTTWPPHPDLKATFLTGYQSPLTDSEEQALPLFVTFAAISYLHAGITQQQPQLTNLGRTALQAE